MQIYYSLIMRVLDLKFLYGDPKKKIADLSGYIQVIRENS